MMRFVLGDYHAGARPGISLEPAHAFLRRALLRLRWAALTALVLLALGPPIEGRTPLPLWAFFLFFAGYTLVYDLLGRRLVGPRFFLWMAMLDLPLAGLLYAHSRVPGGLPFILILLVC